MTERDFDVVVLGATGFVGRLVAEELARRIADTTTSWAIAGRDRAALEAIADRVSRREEQRPAIAVVDIDDPAGMLALTARTRVLATAAGPFARLGEPVARACVASGTHYADITGEPAYVELLRTRYDAEAQARGVKLVTCCGFEAVAPDLGVRYTVDHLPDDVPLTVRGYVTTRARFSGGTATSAVEAIAAGPRSALRGHRSGGTIEAPGQRRAVSLPARIHRVPHLDAYGVPLPTIDPVIVLRSARVLAGYGSAFRYGHYARVGDLPTVVAGLGVVGLAATMAAFGPTRAVLRRLLPDPGEGPDEEQRARSSFEMTFIGHGAGVEVMTRVAGGDPGYDETARMLAAAALSLAHDDGPDVAGVLTPAVGLGEPYHRRLVDGGLRFEVLDPTTLRPREGTADAGR